jgi:signal transduction histidine kinase
MFASVTHELRTPLNAIMQSNRLMESFLSAKGKKYMKTSDNSCTLLMSLIEDVLDFSKLEAGQFKLMYGYFNIREAIV